MLYKYRVKIDNCESPIHSTTRLLKDFGGEKDKAVEWAKKNHAKYEKGRKMVFVEESEYTSEENLIKDFALRRNHIWNKYW